MSPEPSARAAVADTGPLIHLAEIGCLDLLTLFEPLHIADAVWAEAERPASIRSKVRFAKRHSLDAVEVERFANERDLERLHAGDQESLCLAVQLDVSILLTDDLAVRKAARKLSCVPVGSLGIVARACVEKRLSLDAAEQGLRDLQEKSSLYVTTAIVDLAVRQLRDRIPGSV